MGCNGERGQASCRSKVRGVLYREFAQLLTSIQKISKNTISVVYN